MGELDQISMKIGSIESMLTEGVRQRDAMFKKLDELGDKLSEVNGATKAVHESHTALKGKVETQVMPAIEELKSLKQRGIGILAGVAVAAGGASAGVTKLMAKMVGN